MAVRTYKRTLNPVMLDRMSPNISKRWKRTVTQQAYYNLESRFLEVQVKNVKKGFGKRTASCLHTDPEMQTRSVKKPPPRQDSVLFTENISWKAAWKNSPSIESYSSSSVHTRSDLAKSFPFSLFDYSLRPPRLKQQTTRYPAPSLTIGVSIDCRISPETSETHWNSLSIFV